MVATTVYEKEIGSGVRWQPQNDQKETSVETQATVLYLAPLSKRKLET